MGREMLAKTVIESEEIFVEERTEKERRGKIRRLIKLKRQHGCKPYRTIAIFSSTRCTPVSWFAFVLVRRADTERRARVSRVDHRVKAKGTYKKDSLDN